MAPPVQWAYLCEHWMRGPETPERPASGPAFTRVLSESQGMGVVGPAGHRLCDEVPSSPSRSQTSGRVGELKELRASHAPSVFTTSDPPRDRHSAPLAPPDSVWLGHGWLSGESDLPRPGPVASSSS